MAASGRFRSVRFPDEYRPTPSPPLSCPPPFYMLNLRRYVLGIPAAYFSNLVRFVSRICA